MEFGADGARWPQLRGEAAESLPPPPPADRGELSSPRFDSSRALRLLREFGTNVTEDLVVLIPNLLSFLKHDDPAVVKQSIASGTNLFAAVLEEMALQINKFGKLDAWLEETWAWMNKFKDAVRGIVHEPGPVAIKLLALKFVETWILCLTPQAHSDQIHPEGKRWRFDTSRLSQFHPILDPVVLEADANRALVLLLDILQSAYTHRGSFLVGTINSLAAVVKNRPVFYDRVLPALLDFDPGLETAKGAHSASLRYSLKTAFLGFLRCPHPAMIESKDILVRQLRALSPGDGIELSIRQAEKMSRNIERASRANKDEPPTWEMPYGDINRKKAAGRSNDGLAMSDGTAKRARFDMSAASNLPVLGSSDYSGVQVDNDANMAHSSDQAILNNGISPVEKMIEMIGALLAEGERGAESLGILVSTVETDVMADIVIETMKHLPEAPCPTVTHNDVRQQNFKSSSSLAMENLPVNSNLTLFSQSEPAVDSVSIPPSDAFVMPSVHDAKRDPRRDPRRLDPRRTVSHASTNSIQVKVETDSVHQTDNLPTIPCPISGKVENYQDPSGDLPQSGDEQYTSLQPNQTVVEDKSELPDVAVRPEPTSEVEAPPDLVVHSSDVDVEMVHQLPSEVTSTDEADNADSEVDPFLPVSAASTPEDTNHDLPVIPSNVELSDKEKISLNKLAIRRIIDDYKKNSLDARFSLLAHLIAQSAADDNIMDLIQKHIIFHYHDQKGYELAMHVLYQLRSVDLADLPGSCTYTSKHYEMFFISLARSLIDSLPASDKSFSKLLCDAPYLPESSFKLLESLCVSEGSNEQIKDGDSDRVTQGLGTVWSLILGRPPLRHVCLDIALKCAVHFQDEVRGKAVRLVAKKLYDLPYATEKIEQFAIESLVGVAYEQGVDTDVNLPSSKEPAAEKFKFDDQETSVSASHIPDAGYSESGSSKASFVSPKQSAVSVSEAKRHTSLFFALCTKRPSLLQHLFNIYGRSPKIVKQCIHRHIPGLVRNLGSSCPEMLDIIHNSPEGSDHLVTLIVQTLTEESNPSAGIVAAVKHLYKTKLKDASILIPLLSSFPKEEVLSIFPRLVDLPVVKFQDALARILQGTAHSGPALTPAEVLIAIHDMTPEKDNVALKKIIEACTTCFEQRTVFTQQVLERSLNQLVDRVPIPVLFMRTVIQALDAFPALVDFVMGILSRLINKEIWKVPKLWVGFLKLVSQTQPRSFDVLLQLPPGQLERVLHKYPNLRTPLSSFVNQRNMQSILPRQILQVLGFFNEPQQAPMSFVPAALQTADATSSLPGATLL
ncbi:hypothetical protein EJB05_17332 [Eragrostis curvula]|uniref:Symplekin C-terminal domain-containing protein n=1 Tax=Eragrostis curvula TaxID=38414 RepID=A0A5J9VGN2_9POAL|nr:hypothetical protein EJB05_17332 [Eragrostis curvula]